MSEFPAPEELFQELFTDVHQAGFLPDGKAFSDALPLRRPQEILQIYRNENGLPGFDLESFVKQYFAFPQSQKADFQSDTSLDPIEHIESLWEVLTRKADEPVSGSSLIPLPYPYIVPGGRFNEIYYWDSYFTMQGLLQSGRTGMIESMIRNFSYLIDQFGFIPNGNRSYFLSRSQPPFYACMVSLLAQEKGEDRLVEYLPFLKKEHNFWMGERQQLQEAGSRFQHSVLLEGGILLNRYWDRLNSPRPEMYGDDEALANTSHTKDREFYRHIRAACESGWDFSSRWLRDPMDLGTIHTLEILPIDLNCLLWKLEDVLSKGYAWAGIPDQEAFYLNRASERKAAIQRIFWDREQQFFTDYDIKAQASKGVRSLAGIYPLYFKLATQEQARACAEVLERDFLRAGGLVTSCIHSGQQWDAPNGWAPLQWISVIGLRNYGFIDLAEEIRTRWLALNQTVFHRTGKMLEKYNVEDLSLEGGGGEYPVQDGFGWTNGVYLGLKALDKGS